MLRCIGVVEPSSVLNGDFVALLWLVMAIALLDKLLV